MKAITEILDNIFSACGYKVDRSYRFDLIVEKDYVQTAIQIGKPSLDHILAFANTQMSENKLYITPEPVPDNYKRIAQDNDVCVWDKAILEANIGKVILADAQGQCKNTELPISAIHKKDTDSDCSLFKSILTPRETSRETTSDRMREGSTQGRMPDRGYEDTRQHPRVNIVNINSTPLNLDKNAAISIGKREISRVKEAVLLFIPFWAYHYSFNIEKDFKSKVIALSADESGMINAVNGCIEHWEIGNVSSEIEVPCDYEIKNQIISNDEVRNTVIKEAISKNTKTVSFNAVKGQEIISENRTIRPDAHEIKVDMELIYVPVWDVKGLSNSVMINATTHKIFSNPVDDDAEFV